MNVILPKQNKIGNKQKRKELNKKKEKQNKQRGLNSKEKRKRLKRFDFLCTLVPVCEIMFFF